MKKHVLGKEERLKSSKLIDELFNNGGSVSVFPLRMSFSFLPHSPTDDYHLKIGVTASRRNFKKAVDRNRIKRLIREAYRLQKGELLARLKDRGFKVHIFFMYVDKQLPSYPQVCEAMTKCLRLLGKRKPLNESPS